MDFFENLSDLGCDVQWAFSITIDSTAVCTVTLRLTGGDLKDKKLADFPAMKFCGPAKELDEKFFGALRDPAAKAITFFANLKEYERSVEGAQSKLEKKQQSAAPDENKKLASDKSLSVDKEKETKRKKFNVQMDKVKELERAGKIGEAIAKLPKSADFPDFADEIESYRKTLRKQHSGFSLFDGPDGQQENTAQRELSSPSNGSQHLGEEGEGEGDPDQEPELMEPADKE